MMGAMEDEKIVREIIVEFHRRASAALAIAKECGQIDGDHHKMWVIDQMVRALSGEDGYAIFIAEHNAGEDGPDTYSWDEGIAP